MTIDTHHHMLPDFSGRRRRTLMLPSEDLAPLRWSKEATLSFMDDAGIDVAVVSVSTRRAHGRQCQGVGVGAPVQRIRGRTRSRKARPVCKLCLSPAAGCRCVPGRVVLRDRRPRARWRSCCSRTPTACTGRCCVWSRSSKELERRNAVVFVHPNPSPDAVAHSLGLPDNLLDFPTDTNRAVAQMHYTNRFARTPNVKYIFSHAGGSIPYLAARFAIIDEMGFIAGGEQRGTAADMFRRMYWDTALCC